jgi:uncharacterized protein YcaQ
MSLPVISNRDARRAFLAAQGLARPVGGRLTRDGLYGLIEDLGFVQVDSINTVERAHHLILFSRNHGYRHGQLGHLLERKAALFENWTHDASVIPTRFYPYWMCRFAKERETLRERWRKWRPGAFEEMLDEVLDHVRADGPVMARHLGVEDGKKKNADDKSGGWWDWHPSKTALEYLWRTGELAVARREGFQKVYDLTERVIPAEHREGAPERTALIDWACRTALERLVFATSGEIAAFWEAVTPSEAAAWCRARLGDELVEVAVEPASGGKPRTVFAPPDYRERLADTPTSPGAIRVLSPFDPLIRDRNRTERLFDFRYRIEVFVPEAKRQYGYYVFPLLEGDRLIGRIDMKRSKDGTLSVSALWLEPRLSFTRSREAKLASQLDRLARFVGADAVRFENGFLRETD